MCFSAPKAPAPTAEQLALEAEQKAAAEARKAELQQQISRDKAARTEGAIARSTGAFGFRSLISGSKGGAGFGLRSLIN